MITFYVCGLTKLSKAIIVEHSKIKRLNTVNNSVKYRQSLVSKNAFILSKDTA